MNKSKLSRSQRRRVRHARVRARVSGTAQRPRLNVYRSLTSLYVQLIDDVAGKTLASVSSKKDGAGDAGERKGKVAQAYVLGKKIAELAKTQNISQVVFDRGGYPFAGRVSAVAEGARDGGLEF